MDLVGDHGHALLLGESDDLRQLRGTVDAADRVLRVAEDVGDRSLGEGAGQRVEIQAPCAVRRLPQRRVDPGHAALFQPVEERGIDRRVDHDPVAGAAKHAQHLDTGDPDVGRQPYSAGIDRPAPSLGGEPGQRLADVRRLAGVTHVGAVYGLEQDRLDRRCQAEVHLGHGKRQHVGGIAAPFGTAALTQRLEIVDR